MSNYPPGVTGNEYPIAGGTGMTAKVTCPTVGVDMYPRQIVDDLLGLLGEVALHPMTVREEGVRGWRPETDAERFDRLRNRLAVGAKELGEAMRQVDEQCSFEGEVDAEVFNGTLTWTCPLCGADHEDDRYFERGDG